jgi:hypothetical protein
MKYVFSYWELVIPFLSIGLSVYQSICLYICMYVFPQVLETMN